MATSYESRGNRSGWIAGIAVSAALLLALSIGWNYFAEAGSRNYTIERNVLREIGPDLLRIAKSGATSPLSWHDSLRKKCMESTASAARDAVTMLDRLVILAMPGSAPIKSPNAAGRIVAFIRPLRFGAHGTNAFVMTEDAEGQVANLTSPAIAPGGSSRSINEFFQTAECMWDCASRKDTTGLAAAQSGIGNATEYVGNDGYTTRRYPVEQLEALASALQTELSSAAH